MIEDKIKNKNIVLGITGGIAAYKAAYLASFLKNRGANVYTVLTKNALRFITPLTFKTLTKNKVTIEMFDESDFIPHISLADLADIVVIAPATANIIAKAASGIADDMLSTLLLSTKAKKIVVPAMNSNMYLNSITQRNINTLKNNGFFVMEPDYGKLACETEGIGKFPKIERIYGFILRCMVDESSFFYKKKVLITVGGTIEDIDPVRYISNRSSGKMGLSLAEAFLLKGATVSLIVASVSDLLLNNFVTKYPDVNIKRTRSAKEMYELLKKVENDYDVYCMAAAVSDYTPSYSEEKIKKSENNFTLKLTKTIDIISSIKKRKDAMYIAFAAESEDLIENAKKKLKDKQVDFLIANIVKGEKNAIGSEKAEVFILNKHKEDIFKIEYDNKEIVAEKIVNYIEGLVS